MTYNSKVIKRRKKNNEPSLRLDKSGLKGAKSFVKAKIEELKFKNSPQMK